MNAMKFETTKTKEARCLKRFMKKEIQSFDSFVFILFFHINTSLVMFDRQEKKLTDKKNKMKNNETKYPKSFLMIVIILVMKATVCMAISLSFKSIRNMK